MKWTETHKGYLERQIKNIERDARETDSSEAAEVLEECRAVLVRLRRAVGVQIPADFSPVPEISNDMIVGLRDELLDETKRVLIGGSMDQVAHAHSSLLSMCETALGMYRRTVSEIATARYVCALAWAAKYGANTPKWITE